MSFDERFRNRERLVPRETTVLRAFSATLATREKLLSMFESVCMYVCLEYVCVVCEHIVIFLRTSKIRLAAMSACPSTVFRAAFREERRIS